MEFISNLITIVGIPAAILAAWKAIAEFKNGNAEKIRENRHKQAAAAKEILKELFARERSHTAMEILDWPGGRTYRDGEIEHLIAASDLPSALRTNNLAFSAKERFIRDAFEDLFDQLELIEHYTSIDYLNFGDVSVPISYYARQINKYFPAFEPFLDEYSYTKAKKFIERAATL
ncbi:hypothetical protein AAFN46_17110 [Pseudomonas sp. CAU 1711]|uniref:hypothetical protein n=1 Tax=Pseudomonas sp. CAU 1711 TaxID=3140356 RepID=UPI0032618FC3